MSGDLDSFMTKYISYAFEIVWSLHVELSLSISSYDRVRVLYDETELI